VGVDAVFEGVAVVDAVDGVFAGKAGGMEVEVGTSSAAFGSLT